MDLIATISSGVPRDQWIVTLKHYSQIVVYVAFLFAWVQVYKLTCTVSEVVSLNAVISYACLLIVLIIMRVYLPKHYEDFKAFCSPGHNFLKFWITLCFFSYLPQIPATLLPYSALDIFSWALQASVLDIILLVVVGYTCAGCLYIAQYSYGVEKERKDLQVSVVVTKENRASLADRKMSFGRKSVVGVGAATIKSRNSSIGRKSSASVSTNSRGRINSIGRGSTATKSIGDLDLTLAMERPTSSRIQNERPSSSRIQNETTFSDRVSMSEVRNRNGEITADIAEDDKNITIYQYEIDDPYAAEVTDLGSIMGGFNKDNNLIPTTDIPRLSVAQMLSIGRETRANIVTVDDDYFDGDIDEMARLEQLHQNTLANKSLQDQSALVESITSNPMVTREDESPTMAAKTSPYLVKKEPIVLSINDMVILWGIFTILSFIIRFSYGANPTHSAIVFASYSSVYFSYVLAMKLRVHYFDKHSNIFVKSVMQVPIMFMPIATILIILTSKDGFANPFTGLHGYITGLPVTEIDKWGGGDFVNVFLSAAIISLAWATIDAIMKFASLMPILIPIMVVNCFLIAILTSVMSLVMGSPLAIRNALLTKCITTPVAVSLSDLTGGPVALVAGSVVLNSVFLSRCAVPIYSLFKIEMPVTRGLAGALVGTLLVPLALDENGEVLAAGIGMASYGIGTIIYSIIFAINSILAFIKDV